MKEFSIETKKAEMKEKMAMLDIIEDCYNAIIERMHSNTMECKWRTTDRQKQRYNSEIHEYEPVFNDNGEPVYEEEWYYEDYTSDYYDYENRQRDKAIYEKVLKALEKLAD